MFSVVLSSETTGLTEIFCADYVKWEKEEGKDQPSLYLERYKDKGSYSFSHIDYDWRDVKVYNSNGALIASFVL